MTETEDRAEKEDAESRVQRGIDLLNKINPGWATKISLSRFEIMCPFNCVLGKMYGTYQDGIEEVNPSLESSWNFAYRHGFMPDTFADSNELNKVWINKICQLRAHVTDGPSLKAGNSDGPGGTPPCNP